MKELVRRYLAFSNARDLEGMDSLRAPDFQAHVPNAGPISDCAPIDASTLNRDLTMITQAFPDLTNQEQDLVSEGDRVVVRARLSGTFSGPLGTVPPTHQRISWDTVHIYRIEGERIAEAWFVTDTLGLLKQAGAVTVLAPAPELGR